MMVVLSLQAIRKVVDVLQRQTGQVTSYSDQDVLEFMKKVGLCPKDFPIEKELEDPKVRRG